MEERKIYRISVRELVEFIFRSGDIDDRHAGPMRLDAMQKGTAIHQKLQKEMGPTYAAEVPLKMSFDLGEYDLLLEGRADGVFDLNGITCIDEIKGVYEDLVMIREPKKVHLAQAKCYAYILSADDDLDRIGVQMTYADLDSDMVKRFNFDYEFKELSEWFNELLIAYKKWLDWQYEWSILSRNTIKALEFPFEYRPGQKKLVSDVYRTILRNKTLFIQASTGTGKTMSTVFPAVKAVGEGLAERIFYLTAKTMTATVAIEALEILRSKGLREKSVQITAKEKMCANEEGVSCNPDACPYAKGHFDRINDAVFDLIDSEDAFDRKTLLEYAKKHMVCPFEMSLDAALFCDFIIGDYNYVFDPNVYLKRFFGEGNTGRYIFLVDEAHNLVDRARMMYSESMVKEDILLQKKIFKDRSPRMVKALEKVNKTMLAMKRDCDRLTVLEDIYELSFALDRLQSEYERLLAKEHHLESRDEVLEFFFKLRNFNAIYQITDSNYIFYKNIREDGSFEVVLYCANPAENLQHRIDMSVSTCMYSATLLPVNYYKTLLSTNPDNYAVYAKSIFKSSQRLLLIGKDVSSLYKRRTESEFSKFADYILKITSAKKGNYIVFFPSYKMLESISEVLYEKAGLAKGFTFLEQGMSMSEQERADFLSEFEQKRDDTLVGLCVMGGIFGEGVDLSGEKLIGTIIIGTGMPLPSDELKLLQSFFDERDLNGFDYVYRYPGMNKVLQAAGRVIRTVDDKGVIALLDERFLYRENTALFPVEWEERSVCTLQSVEKELTDFWNRD